MLDCISISKLVIASTNSTFLTFSYFATSFFDREDKTLVYYCQNKTCKIPVDTREGLISAIAEEGDSETQGQIVKD